MAHKFYLAFLFIVMIAAALSVSLYGLGYYTTAVAQRPFLPEYHFMKPSGAYSHGLGIIGASMIIVGVSTYSTRKRVRKFWSLGKLSHWLEFHIFLCLLGPTLVVYHTTFKAGGIAAISLWCMLSVAASGVIGRFLYVQIPRNIKGNELTEQEINGELDDLNRQLSASPLGVQVVKSIDESFAAISKSDKLVTTIGLLFRLQSTKRHVRHSVREMIARSHLSHEQAKTFYKLASARAVLLQKTVVLTQVEKLFFYWHAVHLPFTVIMFVALAAHVAVTVFLGYRWIF
ncbi:MAG: hypothetical protein HY961_15545 [Ignavibacteriae bacterium]|nr:hypothetical protein [Ignavibacteriota bacterium]